MKFLSRIIPLIWLSLVAMPMAAVAAELEQDTAEIASEVAFSELNGTHAEDHAAEAHHGLPPAAVPIFELGPVVVTNSMVVSFAVALLLIIGAQMATRSMKDVPTGLQNFFEMLVEGLYQFFEEILGKKMVKQTFWFFATVFIYLLSTNWFGLIPGLGTIGWGHEVNGHFVLTEPLLRGANADLNMTAGLALLFFFLWIKWSLQSIGPGGMVGHIFSVKGHGGGFLGIFLVAVFLFVGVVEIASISIRPMALMFRLYGNIFAGENILETVMHMGGWGFGWLLVLPFYLLELLVGAVQALVFALLTAVFTALMCEHHEEKAH
ncbi:MAG: F0F1 ATP synthase subunit A [Verrucomicrobiota bacterium]|nr:F0F1 ATP synthase subunit A [Verrucomicrobiota bacterium]